jgi:ribosomal-protein-alanine N-acetyltransferase
VEEYDLAWPLKTFETFFRMTTVKILCAVLQERPAVGLVVGPIVGISVISETLDFMEILTLAAEPAFARRGVATLMLKHIMEKYPKPCFLEVAVTNTPAYCLYKKLGFSEVNRRKKYYSSLLRGEGVDAIVMKK